MLKSKKLKGPALSKSNGFTLIELLIVIIIIGILATIAVISYSGVKARANKAVEIQTITDAIKGVAVCAAGGTGQVKASAFASTVCLDTTLTSAKWPVATANGYTIGTLPTVSLIDGTLSGTLTFTTNLPAPNNITCTVANGTATCN